MSMYLCMDVYCSFTHDYGTSVQYNYSVLFYSIRGPVRVFLFMAFGPFYFFVYEIHV